ncbi:cytidylate kinase [Planctomycetes bacterium Pan216]|uniref:Cytidylate kinase n=1 Tax=Kolteria novifilia TaxID=2527975 RepID=A0A518B4X1_9BACT|nr:cytidylate kinase [Planctomycetes bacterium Pan216]
MTNDRGAMNTLHRPVLHGYAPGESDGSEPFVPGITIAVSRQTGSRGRAIAQRTAELLGWQSIDQDTLECMIQHPEYCSTIEESPSPAALEWIEEQVARIHQGDPPICHQEFLPLAQVVLGLSAVGNCVILGRGAGFLLPTDVRLHVRLIAPERDRIAYISEVERLSLQEAERFVSERDDARSSFLEQAFGKASTDVSSYDLILNVPEFGLEGCATLIASAAKAKAEHILEHSLPPQR